MKTILQFLRNTITGGILFLLPLTLLVIVFNKAYDFLLKISKPLSQRLPDIIWGFNGSMLLSIVLLILICFLLGLLYRAKFVKKLIAKIEDNVLSILPGYSLMKSITAGVVGEELEAGMVPAMIRDGDCWLIGFIVEERPDYCTIYIPSAPKSSSGRIMIVPAKHVKKINEPANKISKSLKSFGKGALEWVKTD